MSEDKVSIVRAVILQVFLKSTAVVILDICGLLARCATQGHSESGRMRGWRPNRFICCVICAYLLPLGHANGQDLEPRRWTAMPLGVSVIGAGYGKTTGDIFFDPVLRVEDAEFDAHSVGVSYVRSFSVAGKSARFDALVPWQSVQWRGLLDAQPARATRVGLADPRFRVSVVLGGAPALGPDELRKYMAARPVNTVFGAAIAVTVPWGEYLDDKLLNLGQNRVTVRPQVGVVHTRGAWSYELTGSTFLFTDNDDFFDGSELQQDLLHAMQGHVIRVFRPGLWASLSTGYSWGGRSTLDDQARDDKKANILAALSFGFPIGRSQGVKIAYIRSETREDTGADSNTLAIAWSARY